MIEELAVGQDGDAGGEAFGQGALVGDHDDGHSEGVLNFAEEEKDLLAGGRVEIAGGLVGVKDGGMIYEGAGQGSALLLAAREFAGSMVMAGAEADAVEGLGYAMATLGAVDFGEAEREFHVFREGHAGEGIEGLG